MELPLQPPQVSYPIPPKYASFPSSKIWGLLQHAGKSEAAHRVFEFANSPVRYSGFFLNGNVGMGKSTLAAYAAQLLSRFNSKQVHWERADMLFRKFLENKPDQSLNNQLEIDAPVLVIDELGDLASDFGKGMVSHDALQKSLLFTELLIERSDNNEITLVTSDMRFEHLQLMFGKKLQKIEQRYMMLPMAGAAFGPSTSPTSDPA
jgi:DNA replication protein DnaC